MVTDFCELKTRWLSEFGQRSDTPIIARVSKNRRRSRTSVFEIASDTPIITQVPKNRRREIYHLLEKTLDNRRIISKCFLHYHRAIKNILTVGVALQLHLLQKCGIDHTLPYVWQVYHDMNLIHGKLTICNILHFYYECVHCYCITATILAVTGNPFIKGSGISGNPSGLTKAKIREITSLALDIRTHVTAQQVREWLVGIWLEGQDPLTGEPVDIKFRKECLDTLLNRGWGQAAQMIFVEGQLRQELGAGDDVHVPEDVDTLRARREALRTAGVKPRTISVTANSETKSGVDK